MISGASRLNNLLLLFRYNASKDPHSAYNHKMQEDIL